MIGGCRRDLRGEGQQSDIRLYDRQVDGPILFLGREDSAILAHLRTLADPVLALAPLEPVDTAFLDAHDPAFIVSHGYKVILRQPVLDRFPGRAINLHISHLPWNRGIAPNLWSVLEDTPAGVSLHHIDAGVDTGDLIAQRRITIDDDETLSASYDRLQSEIADLFRETWPAIRAGRAERRAQEGPGSVHTYADTDAVAHLLTDGWDTPAGVLRGRLRR